MVARELRLPRLRIEDGKVKNARVYFRERIYMGFAAAVAGK
jgi:hypothetical protein